MLTGNAHIIAQLQKEILPLQGFKPIPNLSKDVRLGSIEKAFPNSAFPLGAVHEFIAADAEEAAASHGFISVILGMLMRGSGVALWVRTSRTLFPPSLLSFGINPEKIIFIELQKEKEILWAIEEALKCSSIAAVIGELSELSFTASRRLQLAVEQSRVTGFILRRNPRQLNTTACVTRWKITPLPSESDDDLPGVGFPLWSIELLKVRNGRPGSWRMKWMEGSLQPVCEPNSIETKQERKAG